MSDEVKPTVSPRMPHRPLTPAGLPRRLQEERAQPKAIPWPGEEAEGGLQRKFY